MLISDTIAAFIEDMLTDCGGTLEIKRNDLAKRLGCVPSQINYVVSSRFTPEKGYIIESRRGGGGYIRIVRKVISSNELIQNIFSAVGNSLESNEMESILDTLYSAEMITARENRYIKACLAMSSFSGCDRITQNSIRATALKNFLLMLLN